MQPLRNSDTLLRVEGQSQFVSGGLKGVKFGRIPWSDILFHIRGAAQEKTSRFQSEGMK